MELRTVASIDPKYVQEIYETAIRALADKEPTLGNAIQTVQGLMVEVAKFPLKGQEKAQAVVQALGKALKEKGASDDVVKAVEDAIPRVLTMVVEACKGQFALPKKSILDCIAKIFYCMSLADVKVPVVSADPPKTESAPKAETRAEEKTETPQDA